MTFRLNHVHVYALVHNNEIALFDTGVNIGSALEVLEKDLGSIGQSTKSVRDIYITHVHGDHCGMAGLIKKESGAIIHLSSVADESNRNYSQADSLIPRVKKFYLAHGLTSQEVDNSIMVFSGIRDIVTLFKGDDLLHPNEMREFGQWQFEAVFTPGHSNGHICYYFRKEGILLSGDTVLPHITPNLSPDLFDEKFRPLENFLASLDTVANLPVQKVYPGHGNAIDNVRARVQELHAHHAERTQLVLNCLGAIPKTTFQVALGVFGNDLPDFDKFLALNETYVHLLDLKHKGIIREEQDGNLLVYKKRLL
jgi:glyoxylase-like metal-dependent hydrolase (beta-lactamase superfamily II)